jgi:CubicO group peptidase (beta-lactamase class C family)
MSKILLIFIFPFWTLSQQYDNSIDSLLKSYTQEGFGMAALTSKDGVVEYKAAFGMANIELDLQLSPDHKFQIGSITKQFTAVLVLKLEEQGELNLTDPIQKYIPDFPIKNKPITIEHLLTHTSGIPEYFDWNKHHNKFENDYSPNALMELIKDEPLEFDPGDDFDYCNSNYLLLGIIIERVTKQSYNDFLHQEIIDKIGMVHSSARDDLSQIDSIALGYTRSNDRIELAEVEHRSWAFSVGNIISTVSDLNLWYSHLFNGDIISEASLKKALKGFVLNNGDTIPYGYGWYVEQFQGEQMIYHGGSINGFYSYVGFIPDSKTLTVNLANCECVPFKYIGQKITGYAIDQPLVEKEIVKLELGTLNKYSGIYKVDKNRNFIVKRKKDHLYGFFEGMPDEGYNLYASRDGTFFSHDISSEFEFIEKNRRKIKLRITIPRAHKEPIVRLLSKRKPGT